MKKMLSALNSKSNHILKSVEQMRRETKEAQSLDLILRNKHSSNPRDREFNPTISQTIRIEFPQFNGEDPSRRHYHAKVFFYSHQTPLLQVKITSFHDSPMFQTEDSHRYLTWLNYRKKGVPLYDKETNKLLLDQPKHIVILKRGLRGIATNQKSCFWWKVTTKIIFKLDSSKASYF